MLRCAFIDFFVKKSDFFTLPCDHCLNIIKLNFEVVKIYVNIEERLRFSHCLNFRHI